MDIALSSVILVTLLIPGFIFRRFYYTEEFSKEFFTEKITDNLLSTIIISAIIHYFGYWLLVRIVYRGICGGIKRIDIELISNSLTGDVPFEYIAQLTNNIKDNCWYISAYCLCLAVFSAWLGNTSKKFVRLYKLDRKYKLFRFQNEWHYFFSGEMLDFPGVLGSFEEVDFKWIDVLVDSNDGLILYSGYLEDYVLSKEGGIDRIYLGETQRRYLKDDVNPKYYVLPGKYFAIPYSEIKNIHITYYAIQIDPNNMPQPEEVEPLSS